MPASGPTLNKNPHKHYTNISLLAFIYVLLRTASCNTVSATLSSTSLYVGAYSNITATIDRTRGIDGTPVTTTNVSTSVYTIVVVLDAAYKMNISSAIVVNASTNWTVDLSMNTFTVRMQSPLFNTYSISIINVRNPLVSLTALTTMIYFKDANGNTIDQAYNTLTYNFILFSQSDITASFTPANVSTISSLSLTVNSSVYSVGAGLYMQISFRRWWMRSLSNTSSTAIFSTTSSCVPSCAITYQTQATLVLFASASLSQSYSSSTGLLNLTFIYIQSPPTLQPIDQIQLILREPTTSTILQKIDNFIISTLLPNSLQSLTAFTSNSITQTISLQMTIISRNLFGPNDTLTLKLTTDSPITSTDPSNVVLSSPLISGYQVNIQDFYTIVISSFTFVSSNYAPLNAYITIDKIVPAASTKPRVNNLVQLRRNGYLFNTAYFLYQVIQAIISNITVSLDNNYANSQATCTWMITFSKGVSQYDMVYLNIDQSISITTCQPQCQNCTCTIAAPTTVNPFTSLLITIPSTQLTPINSLTITSSVRNPIQSPLTPIKICSTDSSNYTKQCGNVTYPTMVQASISSTVLSVSMSNVVVFGIGTYTFYYNFTSYDLQNGYLITVLPSQIVLVDPGNLICKINGQPLCRILTINSSGTYINTTVTSFTKIYTLIVSNLRNPASTQPFTISAKVAYITNQIYYSVISDYVSATIPYTLQLGTHYSASSTNCTNNQLSTLSISFTILNLPFSPILQFPNMSYLQYRISNSKTNSTVTLLYPNSNNNTVLQYQHRNYYTMQAIQYIFVMYTGNLLYQVWQFRVTQQNCLPQSIPIVGYQFGGLPEDTGTLTIAYTHRYLTQIDSTNTSYTIRLTFPNQYPASISLSSNPALLSVTTLSARAFSLRPLISQQPIILQLSSFTNVLNINNNYTSNPLLLQIFVNGFLVAQDNSTIVYRLSDVSDCAFPCKVCSAGNGVSTGICLGCYSSAVTNSYLLSNARCVSACTNATYQSTTANICLPCPVSCISCSSSTICSNCSNNYYLFNQSCLTDCPSGWYPLTITQACSSCTAPCLSCSSPSQCRSCVTGFSLFNSTTCVTSCPTGYLAQVVNGSSFCFACLSPCLQCSGSLSTCTKCVTGFYLDIGGICAISCTALSIGYQGICTACTGTCYRCIDTPSKCMSCTNPYMLYQSSCITNCPVSYYSFNNTCLPCSPQCSSCSSLNNCSLCSNSFIYYQQFCWSSCPTSMFVSSVNITNTNTNTNNITMTRLECQPCALASCLSCIGSADNCVVCANGTYLYQSTCLNACPIGMYVLGHICAACSTGCLTCLSSTQCLTCAQQYAIYLSSCVSACPSGMMRVNNTCQLCSSSIVNCQTCTALGCTSCISNYYLLPNSSSTYSSCILQCPQSYLPSTLNNISQCIPCSTNCQSCSIISTNCTACISGYLLYLNSCVSACPTGMVAADSMCVSCRNPCLTCSNNSTLYCQSCVSNLYLLAGNNTRQCVTSCPDGYYNQNSTHICVQCGTGCSSCISGGCLSCSAGYFVHVRSNNTVNNSSIALYDCYSICPDYLPFVIAPNTCSACSQHCLQCQGSTSNYICLQCTQSYLIYTKYCVVTCPSPYQPSSSLTQCIIVDNSTSNNTTNNSTSNTTNSTTNSTTNTTTTMSMPVVPFSIAAGAGLLLAAISKLQYSWSNWIMTALAISCILAPICQAVYLALLWLKVSSMVVLNQTQTESTRISASSYINMHICLYLLIISLSLIYLSNILHIIFSYATYRKDPLFLKYTRKHPYANRIILIFSLIFQHLLFVLYFCRWFNFSIFRAALQNIYSLSCLNYLWGMALVGNIVGIVAGILIIITDTTTLLYPGVDLIIVNAIVLILGLLLFRKSKGAGYIQEDYQSQPGYQVSQEDYQSKKVVMLNNQGGSQAHIANILGEQEEINGKISKRPFLDISNKVQPEVDQNQQNKQQNQKQDEDFYFQQQNADNMSPNKVSIDQNISQAQTQGNKKSNGSQQNSPDNDIYSSQGTNPMKIEPSINMIFTAQQMKPIHDHEDVNQDMIEKGLDSNFMANSNSWAQDKQKSSIILKNQSKISPHSNIFDEQDPGSPSVNKLQQESQNFNFDKNQSDFTNNNENKVEKSNKLVNSQNSSKSLKATPRSIKSQKGGNSPTLQNLAAAGLNKSRKSGGRSSQQFTSMQTIDNESSNKKAQKIAKKYSLDDPKMHDDSTKVANKLSRTGSRVSNRISSSNLMGIIEQQNEDQIGKNKQKYVDQEQQRQVKQPSVIIATGEDRFLSQTLQQDSRMEAVSQYEADINTVEEGSSPKKQSSRLFKRESRHSLSSQISAKRSSKSRSPHINKQLSSKHSISPAQISPKKQHEIKNVALESQIQQKQEKNQKNYTFGSKQSSPTNPHIIKFQQTDKSNQQKQQEDISQIEYHLGIIKQKQSEINHKNEVKKNRKIILNFQQSEQFQPSEKEQTQQKSKKQQNFKSSTNVQLKPGRKVQANIRNKYVSAGTIPAVNKLQKLRQKQTQSQRQNATIDGRSSSTSQRKQMKAFRSRNISVDKLRPSTSQYQSSFLNEDNDDEYVRINTKALMKQIERKQKNRNQQQSLKKIYLNINPK